MEEFEFDEFVDAVLGFGECARCAARQYVDRSGWKDLLQSPDRRNRRDEVADVIDLHHQDPLDLIVMEQGVAGVYRLDWFVVGTVVVGVARQARTEIWITAGEYGLPTFLEMAKIEYVFQAITAGGFVMQQRCIRRVYDELAALVSAQAEVEIVVDDLVRFLEAAERLVDAAPHQHAGAGHCNDVALGQCKTEIARIIRWGETEGMARDAWRGKEHARVLHLVIGVEQLRTDHRHFRPIDMFQHDIEPIRLDHFDVVIQEQQVLAGGCFNADIVEMRPVEFVRHRHDLVGVLLQPELPGDLIVGNVIDADDLEISIRGAFAQ